jgi:glutamine amidotransferase-like uncharacterized protein
VSYKLPSGDIWRCRVSRRCLSVASVFLLAISIASCQCSSTEEKSATVALYSDHGVWDSSLIAATNMFEWMGYTVAVVDAEYINDVGLDNFRVLCVPGGDMYQYSQDISAVGKEHIRDFVKNGGGYIGICGGAYFASERVIWQGQEIPVEFLGLFSGTAQGAIDEIAPYPDYAMCQVNIVEHSHPITEELGDSVCILYYWGPMLLPDQDAGVDILGRYQAVDEPCMVAFEYGAGRVFLIGTHPEIEEDSDRDGAEEMDELVDPDSEWDMMKNATQWCLKEIE